MSTSEERPRLQYVSHSDARELTDDGVRWQAGVTEDATGCTEFTFGTGEVAPGASGRITPELAGAGDDIEQGLMLTGGTATVTVDGDEHVLDPYDAVFAPPGADYTFENRSDGPVTFIWGGSTGEKVGDIPESQIADTDGEAQVVRTVRDLDAVVTLNEGHSKRYWVPICPEVCGAREIGMGIIKRPPGSVAPLHEHEPPTLTEAFTVAEGRMLVTDQDGEEFVVDEDDFLYVPEYGKHTNKNVGTTEMTYAFIECPTRSRELIAEREQSWYDDS